MFDQYELRIGINEVGGDFWTGGITYRKNLIEALKLVEGVKVYLIKSQKGSDLGMKKSDIIVNGTPKSKAVAMLNKLILVKWGRNYYLGKKLEGKIDVLFPSNIQVGQIPVISWIPDFQFIHYPEFHTEAQLKHYKKLKQRLKQHSLIVLSSHDAKNDLISFAPEYVHKTRILRFVAHVPNQIYIDDPKSVVRKYNLPESFIYLPNQFWAHKNHIVVIKALELLNEQRGIKPVIVCTGNPIDRRNPTYLANLLRMVSEAGIRSQFILLGFVDHEDVYKLIRQAKFVLNPSLFEGWSTTVEEAKSVGKRMLLSNINVHIEQNPSHSEYFDPYSVEELASKLEYMWNEIPPGPDLDLENEARAMLTTRMREFANTFISIAKEVI